MISIPGKMDQLPNYRSNLGSRKFLFRQQQSTGNIQTMQSTLIITINFTVNMASIIRKIKLMTSFSNLKAEEWKVVTPLPLPKKIPVSEHEEKWKLAELVDNMLKEVDLMPNKYKVRHQNHPFLNEFLWQVNSKNLYTIYNWWCHLPLHPSLAPLGFVPMHTRPLNP